MNILVILAHPNPASFNHAISAQAMATLKDNGHTLFFHDLYAEGFDPVLPAAKIPEDGPVPPLIQEHCRELAQADGIVIVPPHWWGQPPAILKGRVDRVFRPGEAYKFAPGDGGEGCPWGCSGPAPPWCSIPPTPRPSGRSRSSGIPWKPWGASASSPSAGCRSSTAAPFPW